ncbi:MAG: 2-dehydropantoate 2-reductase [Candidatus Omnitrophota bacterium]
MKIAVIGAGAIGNLVAGYLKLKDEDVSLVGTPDSLNAIQERGLKVSGARGDFHVKIDISERLLEKPDLVILACKTQDIDAALKGRGDFLKETSVVTVQNGVQADSIVAKYAPQENIVSSIVMFGATYLEPGKVVHNFEGPWIIGRIFDGARPDEKLISLSLILDKAFPVIISEDIKGMKYLKIFVNANNCLAAILGKSMQEAFADLDISRLSIAIWKEGFEVITKAGINLVSLPGFPVENLTKLTAMPAEEAAKIFSGIMAKLSKEPLYGSILQSIKRGRPSEVDYINGEFFRIAEVHRLSAPLNKKLAGMVHEVERSKRFFSKDELLASTKYLLN